MTSRSGLFALLVLIVLGVGFGSVLGGLRREDPNAALVVCEKTRTLVERSTQARPDGVHIAVDNESGAPRSLDLSRNHLLPSGAERFLVATGSPRSILVFCIPPPSLDVAKDYRWMAGQRPFIAQLHPSDPHRELLEILRR